MTDMQNTSDSEGDYRKVFNSAITSSPDGSGSQDSVSDTSNRAVLKAQNSFTFTPHIPITLNARPLPPATVFHSSPIEAYHPPGPSHPPALSRPLRPGWNPPHATAPCFLQDFSPSVASPSSRMKRQASSGASASTSVTLTMSSSFPTFRTPTSSSALAKARSASLPVRSTGVNRNSFTGPCGAEVASIWVARRIQIAAAHSRAAAHPAAESHVPGTPSQILHIRRFLC
jgi:hypothetical protein